MNDVALGFQVMAYGLLGVFSVIILFYGMIATLGKIYPADKED